MAAEKTTTGGVPLELAGGEQMSLQRKYDAVLRLLRGEDLETVSRALGITAATLSDWRDAFVAAGEAALDCLGPPAQRRSPARKGRHGR
jgi:hypothetical protein